MVFDRKDFSNEQLQYIYKELLKPRLIEEKMLVLLRQGKISKWFSGIGQEAISVGTVLSMDATEYILPMHRNLGIFTGRKIPLGRLFKQFQGKMGGFTKGRDRSFHFGTNEFNLVGMISHLGPQMGVADGIALAEKIDQSGRITAVFTGDGGASEGDFHESINVAAVWELPVIFIVENNGYGLSTPSIEQFRCKQFVDKAIGYGIEGVQCDGNNVLDVMHKLEHIRQEIKKSPRPFLFECFTFRMRGHEEASGTKYVPPHLFEEWGLKDPIINFENYLLSEQVISPSYIADVKQSIKTEIEDGLNEAYAEEKPSANTQLESNDMYRPHMAVAQLPSSPQKKEMRLLDAIHNAMHQALLKHPNLIIMGQDIAEYGGVFKATQGFVEEFGKTRIRNTPLCESAIIGAGLGLSIKGKKSIIEMQFADFVTCGFNQIINNLAKTHYRWGQHADVVVRMPTGAGVGAGPFHSQSNEGWFFHTPGLKVVYPAFPSDAKGLLLAAIEDPNPVMFFEHKALYRSVTEEVNEDYYTLPIGKGRLVTEGSDATIITYGYGVHWAMECLKKNGDISADLIDLRTLLPWDKELVLESVRKTGRVIILHEDTLTGGIGAEISATISAECFDRLDAPVMRCASLDTAIPMSQHLEENFLPAKRFEAALTELIAY